MNAQNCAMNCSKLFGSSWLIAVRISMLTNSYQDISRTLLAVWNITVEISAATQVAHISACLRSDAQPICFVLISMFGQARLAAYSVQMLHLASKAKTEHMAKKRMLDISCVSCARLQRSATQ